MVGKIKERKNNWNIKQKIVIPGIYRWSFEIFDLQLLAYKRHKKNSNNQS